MQNCGEMKRNAVLHLFLVVPGCTDVCVCMLLAPSHPPPLQLTEARRTDGE